ncbi:MAG: hypothetical protein HKN07_08725 [Acidimicrobiia bacterium]|nr:hypothetical protein [Acidimicrobiia bacterium]NNF64333.1 hypothetical protein [Acidimicrobiia bacterium]
MLFVGGLIGLVALAVSIRSEGRNVSTYLDLAKQVADSQEDVALSLHDVFLTLGDTERNDMLDRLGRLEAQSAAMLVDLEDAEIPGPAQRANAFLTVAVSSWTDALSSFDDAFTLILDEVDDRDGKAMLDAAFATLRVGDRAYAGFEAALADMEEGIVTREYPQVRYVGGDRAALYDAATISTRLLALNVLSERHDLAVSALIQPEPAGEQNGFPVLPWTPTVEIQVVVTNAGNETEFEVPVTLQYKSLSDANTIAIEEIIASLAPGEATSVVFSDLDITPGVIYEAEVRIRLAEDVDGENDFWSLQFVRNNET